MCVEEGVRSSRLYYALRHTAIGYVQSRRVRALCETKSHRSRRLLCLSLSRSPKRAPCLLTCFGQAEFPQTGAVVRLYVALGIRPEAGTPRCAAGAVASWHPLRSIFPPVNSILRADHGATGGPGGYADVDEEGGLVLEAGIAPFLAKLKALLNKCDPGGGAWTGAQNSALHAYGLTPGALQAFSLRSAS
jgi:hypothetical protein